MPRCRAARLGGSGILRDMIATLSPLVPSWYRPPRSANDAVQAAARVFDVTRQEILGADRCHRLCRARWAVMVALRQRGYSLPRIGRALGDRDHTTVMSGLKRAAAIRAVDPEYDQQCARVALS